MLSQRTRCRRESQDIMEMGEFMPVEPESVISTPRKVELLMELGLRGFRSSDKRVQAKLTWIAENSYLENQLNVQVRDELCVNLNPRLIAATNMAGFKPGQMWGPRASFVQ